MTENPPAATVVERCTIQPQPHLAAELTLPLLHFDMPWLSVPPIHSLLFFDFPCSRSHFLESIVPAMKHSLIQTLTHFLPLAGKIVFPLNSGMPFSRFAAGDSVPFTIAECDNDFARLTGNHPRVADEFYACVPHLLEAKHSSDDVVFPVLALQITLFPDQGVCFGFTAHHAIGDASSIVRFIKAWGAVNRHGSDAKLIEEPSMLPYFDRTTVSDHDGLDLYSWNIMKHRSLESPLISFPLNKHRATFVLTIDEVQKLKNYVQKNRPEMRTTAFTAVCALVWVYLVRVEAEAVADEEPERMLFPAECRGRLKPPLPAEYFGNCVVFVSAVAAHGVLKSSDGLAAAAESIANGIQKTVYNEKGILDGAENWLVESGKVMRRRPLLVAGSPRFDVYDVDYGWGRPKKFELTSIDSSEAMTLSKSRDFEGGLEIGLSRPHKVLDSFAAMFAQSFNDL